MPHQNHCRCAQNALYLKKKVERLDDPVRMNALPPETILDALPIASADIVLDLGAGSGYLTIPAAERTGGTVYALDLDAQILDVIASKAAKKGLKNIELLQSDIESIPLSSNSIDIVMAALVLHEVDSPQKAVSEISRLLKTGGCFLCIDYETEEESGPPMHMRISSTEMADMLIASGLRVKETQHTIRSLYVMTAQKE